MKHLSTFIEAKPKPLTNSLKRSRMPHEWIARIFAKLQARYGHKWTSSYPAGETMTLAVEEWSEILGSVTAEEVKRGLDAWDSDWPPTAPEFRKACRSGKAYHTEYRTLPKPKMSKREAQEVFSKLHAAINKRNLWGEVHGMRVFV